MREDGRLKVEVRAGEVKGVRMVIIELDPSVEWFAMSSEKAVSIAMALLGVATAVAKSKETEVKTEEGDFSSGVITQGKGSTRFH